MLEEKNLEKTNFLSENPFYLHVIVTYFENVLVKGIKKEKSVP